MKFVLSIHPGLYFQVVPNSVYEEGSFDIDPEIFELGIPILGICYGMQLLTHKLGGRLFLQVTLVTVNMVNLNSYSDRLLLFCRHSRQTIGLMSHGDAVTEIPAGFFIALVLLLTVHLHPLKIQIRKSTVSNSTQRFVTLFTVMISFVTLP